MKSNKKSIPSPYARYVKKLRLSLGLSISAMARVAGMSPSYWAQMEKGKKGPPSQENTNQKLSVYASNNSGDGSDVSYALYIFRNLESLCGRLPADCMKIYQRKPETVLKAIRAIGL